MNTASVSMYEVSASLRTIGSSWRSCAIAGNEVEMTVPSMFSMNRAVAMMKAVRTAERMGGFQAPFWRRGENADALRLGCSAIGFTIYPGSDQAYEQFEEFRELAEEAKAAGLAVVLWSYPRGGNLSKQGETAVDICAYAAHMAALLGAHIINVKPPTPVLELDAAKKVYEAQKIPTGTLAERVRHVVQSCFNGRRLVVFSGGEAKDSVDAIYDEVRQIRDGGGSGSIIGRNTFQRPRAEALALLDNIVKIYLGQS